MKIMFRKGSNFIILPITPYVENIEQSLSDEEFETVNNGTLLLIGEKGLRKFTLSSFLPSKFYSFMNIGSFAIPKIYINFFEKLKEKKEPTRIIIISKGKVILNMECRVNFNYGIADKAGDVPYTLEVVEYRKQGGYFGF